MTLGKLVRAPKMRSQTRSKVYYTLFWVQYMLLSKTKAWDFCWSWLVGWLVCDWGSAFLLVPFTLRQKLGTRITPNSFWQVPWVLYPAHDHSQLWTAPWLIEQLGCTAARAKRTTFGRKRPVFKSGPVPWQAGMLTTTPPRTPRLWGFDQLSNYRPVGHILKTEWTVS